MVAWVFETSVIKIGIEIIFSGEIRVPFACAPPCFVITNVSIEAWVNIFIFNGDTHIVGIARHIEKLGPHSVMANVVQVRIRRTLVRLALAVAFVVQCFKIYLLGVIPAAVSKTRSFLMTIMGSAKRRRSANVGDIWSIRAFVKFTMFIAGNVKSFCIDGHRLMPSRI